MTQPYPDTTGAVGSPTEADSTPESYEAGTQETTEYGGGGIDDPGNQYVTGTFETSGAGGGTADHHDYAMGTMTGTLDTQSPGSPSHHADPVYRASSPSAPGTVKDTTWTDLPISDGLPRTDYRQNMSETLDTVNFEQDPVPGNLVPPAPAAPTVSGAARGALVTITEVADPVGAPVTAYRIEVAQGNPLVSALNDYEDHWPGVDWAPRNPNGTTTTAFVANLSPDLPDIYQPNGSKTPGGYRFRVLAVNARGTSDPSPWSALVQAYNPDEQSVRKPAGLTVENRINPIYDPKGLVKPGTGGTTGPVRNLTAAPTATPGELTLTWTVPEWGDPDGYRLVASSGQVLTVGDVTTATMTGLTSGQAVTVSVTPTNERGSGVSATSPSATPL